MRDNILNNILTIERYNLLEPNDNRNYGRACEVHMLERHRNYHHREYGPYASTERPPLFWHAGMGRAFCNTVWPMVVALSLCSRCAAGYRARSIGFEFPQRRNRSGAQTLDSGTGTAVNKVLGIKSILGVEEFGGGV